MFANDLSTQGTYQLREAPPVPQHLRFDARGVNDGAMDILNEPC